MTRSLLFPVRIHESGRFSWARMPVRFQRRVRARLRDPQARMTVHAPHQGGVFKDPVTGAKVWFQRTADQVMILGVTALREQMLL
jgi:hypothetical protein